MVQKTLDGGEIKRVVKEKMCTFENRNDLRLTTCCMGYEYSDGSKTCKVYDADNWKLIKTEWVDV